MDASVKGTLILPIKNVISYLCQWEFSNTNGTTVIAINFKNNESNISCRLDFYTLTVTDGKNLDLSINYTIVNYLALSDKIIS